MKSYQIILNFRKAYFKLEYRKRNLTVNYLHKWTKIWCQQNNIPNYLLSSFQALAVSYMEKEWQEHYIPYILKKLKYSKTSIPGTR